MCARPDSPGPSRTQPHRHLRALTMPPPDGCCLRYLTLCIISAFSLLYPLPRTKDPNLTEIVNCSPLLAAWKDDMWRRCQDICGSQECCLFLDMTVHITVHGYHSRRHRSSSQSLLLARSPPPPRNGQLVVSRLRKRRAFLLCRSSVRPLILTGKLYSTYSPTAVAYFSINRPVTYIQTVRLVCLRRQMVRDGCRQAHATADCISCDIQDPDCS